jgi:hypothetical protein
MTIRTVGPIQTTTLSSWLLVWIFMLVPSVALGLVIVRGTNYDETYWAQTDLLPGGIPTVFVGDPVASMLGADAADTLLEDVVIPVLNIPVTARIQQVLLNEKGLLPFKLNGEFFILTIKGDPTRPSLGTITFTQTSPDDHGPAPEGTYTREQTVNFTAALTPIAGGPPIVAENSVLITSAFPIPFSFDPEPNVLLKSGLVGDFTANIHTDLGPDQRNFFTLPSHGVNIFKAPSGTAVNFRGGGRAVATFAINGDECPFDPLKLDAGFTGCGNSDVDLNNNGVPDFFEPFGVVPEPSTLILLVSGILVFACVVYRRSRWSNLRKGYTTRVSRTGRALSDVRCAE